MNSPLFVDVLFQPLSGNDVQVTVSAYGDSQNQVLGQGTREYIKAAETFELADVAGIEPPFNATFVDVRRLRNLTPEQAEAIAKEWAIEIKPLPGSNAPSMGG